MGLEDMKQELKERFNRFKGHSIHPDYVDFKRKVEKLEKEAVQLPSITLSGLEYFPLMLTRPICMMKGLLTWSDPKDWGMIVREGSHVKEEIKLLRRDLKYLEEAWERGGKIKTWRS